MSITKSTIDVEDTKTEQQAAAEDEICFVGYVLDSYCIDRGTLLDGYQTESLLEPQRHSIHCLVDVGRCVHSGYELLADPDIAGNKFCRAFQLDDHGNQLMLELARSTGEQGYCESCTGPPGAPSRGFRATVYGTIVNNTNNYNPPLLQVTRVQSIRDGCLGTSPYIPPPESLYCESGSFLPFVAAHGSLMLLSWGFLLPLGIISARLLKHFPHSQLWFRIHRVVQPLGILTALAGWITALAGPFNVLGSGVYDAQFVHAIIGTIVMGLGLLQPINAYLRPHKKEMVSNDNDTDDENNDNGNVNDNDNSNWQQDNNNNHDDISSLKKRQYWEWGHKTIGYFAALFGMVNCFIGMALSGKYQDKFFSALVTAWAFLAFYGLALAAHRCWQYRCQPSSSLQEQELSSEQDVLHQVAQEPIIE